MTMYRPLISLATAAALFLSTPAQPQHSEVPMAEIALFLTVKTQPGRRDALLALWDKHLRDRAAENDAQIRYVIALDMADPDTVHISEVYSGMAAFEANSMAPWFADYMAEAGPLLAAEPSFSMAKPHWVK